CAPRKRRRRETVHPSGDHVARRGAEETTRTDPQHFPQTATPVPISAKSLTLATTRGRLARRFGVADRRGGPVGAAAALSTAWGPYLLGGGVRGGERVGDCLRPLAGGARTSELAYFVLT